MKILFVEQLGKNNWEYVYSAAKYMAIEHDVTCFMSDTTPRNTGKYNFKIIYGFNQVYEGSYINKATHYLKALREIKSYIKENKFDIVHFEWFLLPWYEWLWIRGLKKYAKIVITVHDVIPFEARPLEMQCLEKIYQAADAILLHTNECLDLFNKMYNTNCYKSVITTAFRDKADYTKIDKEKARTKMGIPNDKIVVLYFGTIRQSKGLDLLIKAMPKAVERNKKLYLLGAGALHAVNQHMYEELVKDYLNPSIARLDFGYVPDEMMIYYFSAADILCLPYREIYQSGIAQFGLIYELPIVGSNLIRMSDMVQQGVNAETFKREDFDGLVDALVRLSTNQDLMEKYALGSKMIGESDFSVEERARRSLQAYSHVMNEKKVDR